MSSQHPMQRYMDRSSPRFGCFVLLVLFGLSGGIFFYLWDTRPTSKVREGSHAIAMLETSAALINGTPTPSLQRAAPEVPESITLVPTPENLVEQLADERRIIFPSAGTSGRIVTVQRIPGGWDVAYLQDLVGHLEGTSWLGDSGNTVLAGHFEDQIGRPGPFRYLYNAKVGDTIIIQDGKGAPLLTYQVVEVFRTDPDDLEILRHSSTPRLTLITCDSWDQNAFTYAERLVVIAEPLQAVAASPQTDSSMNGIN